jgi:uncharacterized membrane protein (DUF485 family)
MNVNANYQNQANPSSLQDRARNIIGLTLANLALYMMPILLLAFSVSYWMPNNYVLLFVALSVGQAIGALLVLFLERRRISETALRSP